MSVDAYLVVQVDRPKMGNARSVRDQIAHLDGVENAEVVTGPHDVIAEVSVADMTALSALVMNGVNEIPGVAHAMTLVVLPQGFPEE